MSHSTSYRQLVADRASLEQTIKHKESIAATCSVDCKLGKRLRSELRADYVILNEIDQELRSLQR